MGKKENNRLETWGNETTMNMNAIIYQNILSSPYFRSLYEKKTFHEIVDEIYNEAPFIKGNQPSTAFCLLFKLWTIRLTIRQIENLVEHGDSPYIRAIGFLYLRYVCAPAKLWDWFQYYLEDDEEIAISSGLHPTKVTVGNLIRMLITELKFQGTMLPRIPIPIARDLEKKLKEYDEAKKKEKGSDQRDNYESDKSDHSDRRYKSRSRSHDRRHRDRSPYDRRYRDRSPSYDRRYRDRSPSYDRRHKSRSRSPRRSRRDEFDEYERYRERSRDRKYDDRTRRRRYSRSRERY
ncbi:PRP38 pre-mRNA processing factor 38 domain-containing protein B [Rhizopus azygosporus]|uniref:Pre-mRNA-splicing factor 38 n=1 Tax=Rhizopus azygosporus TaxID=86630 RepID=A0A367JFG8_RHIAZ|nr:PRP38 pre-mRNA processing factor 38 domain-containing protein B [Rhizopus azygosporus]